MTSVEYADDFSARLSLALQACNLSRAQLSSLLGVHKSMVSRWLSGEMKPTGYNLARISAALAKAKPGFNMTLWTAPRAEFEAALGLSSINGSSAGNLESETLAAQRPRMAKQNSASVSLPQLLLNARSAYTAAATIILFILAAGAWLWWRSASAPPAPTPPATAPALESVAVLPFVNMSGDPAKDYLGDGMAEEILNDLANTPSLRVAARTSSFSFKGKHTDIHEIAKTLNVRTVLEGSVRQEGERVRIVAQLIDATNGFHMWSARYDRKLDDILAVQDQIAGAIAGTLSQKLVPTRARRSVAPEAYRDYLQAQYFFRQRTTAGLKRADDLLKTAIARQPDFAAAYAMRAHLLILTVGDDRALVSEAKTMITKALQLEPGNQDALDTKLELSLHNWDWPAAYGAGRQLLAQPRRSASAYNGIGFFYQYMGFPKLALEARRQAAELDPLAFSYRNNLSMALWHVGRLNEAIEAALGALDVQPNHLGGLYNLCQLSAAAGKISEARHYAQLIAALPNPQFPWVPSACEIEIALGEHQNAQALVLLNRMDATKVGNVRLGLLYARAGDLNSAMKLFSEAYNGHDQSLVWIRYDVGTTKAVLSDLRWQALWRRPLLAEWQRYHDRIAADLARARH